MRVTGSIKQNKCAYLIGVAGGSGSGKTYFARAVQDKLGTENCSIIYQDSFYIDQSARFDFDGGSVNFDHPDSIDFDKLAECLQHLKSGKETEIPIYDFKSHSRSTSTERMVPRSIVLVDGILIFHATQVRSLFDHMVFFNTPEDLRFQRRLKRDVHERGRTPDGVRNQFMKQVKPMHDMYVEPSKVHAETLVNDVEEFDAVLKLFCQKLAQRIT